jgi:hypothetical protein
MCRKRRLSLTLEPAYSGLQSTSNGKMRIAGNCVNSVTKAFGLIKLADLVSTRFFTMTTTGEQHAFTP